MFLVDRMFTTLEALKETFSQCVDFGCVFLTADSNLPVTCNDCDGKPSLILYGLPFKTSQSSDFCPVYQFRAVARVSFCVDCVDDADSSANFAQDIYNILGKMLASIGNPVMFSCSAIIFEDMVGDGVENGCLTYSISFIIK